MRAINEDAKDDVLFSQFGENLLNAVVSFLHKFDEDKLPTVVLHNRSCPYVDSSMFQAKGAWRDVMVIFFNHETSFAGRAAKMHSTFDGHQTRYAIFIRVEDGLTPKELYRALCNSKVRNTFRHEAQHIMDKKRIAMGKFEPKEGEPEVDNNDDTADDRDLDKYFNNPMELNAYFHNVAEPILQRMRWMHQVQGHDTIGLFDELPTDYRAYLARRLTELRGTHKMFWEHLNGVNKRKVITRLMKLYDLFSETLAAYKEQGDKYIEISKDA